MPSQLVAAVCRCDFSRFLPPLVNFDADVSSGAIARPQPDRSSLLTPQVPEKGERLLEYAA
jgi:hypothetical protein